MRGATPVSTPLRVGELVVTGDQDGRLWLDAEELVRLDGDTFVPALPRAGWHRTLVFLGDDGHGHPQFLHGGRAHRRLVT